MLQIYKNFGKKSNKRKYFENKENFQQLQSKKLKGNTNPLKNCIDGLLTAHNIDELCAYVQSKLKDLPNYLVDTEVPVEIYRNKVKVYTLYADLSVAEIKAASNAKRCNNNWETMEEKAKKVEKMSKNEIRQPKCGNSEKFDKGKTIQTIFDEAGRQLLNYVNNLKDDNYETSAFVVMSVGSRKLIWEKVY
ncbi:9067_t:CDS:2 [Gigaspora rosea]|nr:9067_t:CDS:2 [Gigaspora rosea]